jgi:hypothetical protein
VPKRRAGARGRPTDDGGPEQTTGRPVGWTKYVRYPSKDMGAVRHDDVICATMAATCRRLCAMWAALVVQQVRARTKTRHWVVAIDLDPPSRHRRLYQRTTSTRNVLLRQREKKRSRTPARWSRHGKASRTRRDVSIFVRVRA